MDKAIGEFCTLASAMSTDPRSVALTPVEVVVCWESWLFILLVKILKEEFPNVKFSYKEREKFMPERGTLDITKAKKLIGYKPSFPLEDGYLKYIDWYKNFYKLMS